MAKDTKMLKNMNKIFGSKFKDLNDPLNKTKYIDTGNYIMNAILSGSIFGGIPTGKIVTIAAESGSGKSLVSLKMAKKHQDEGYKILWYDEENNIDSNEMLHNFGINTDDGSFMIVDSDHIEEFGYTVTNYLDMVAEERAAWKASLGTSNELPEPKHLIVLDSLGALSSERNIMKTEEMKTSADMGHDAKTIKRIFKSFRSKLYQTNTSMIVIQHVHADPSPFAGMMPKIDGGKFLKFISHLIVLMSKKVDKNAAKDKNTEHRKTVANVIDVFAYKSRIIKETSSAKMYIHLDKGLHKYYGLLDLAPPTIFEATNKDKTSFLYHRENFLTEEDKQFILGQYSNNVVKVGENLYKIEATKSSILKATEFKFSANDEKGFILVNFVPLKVSDKEVYKNAKTYLTKPVLEAIDKNCKDILKFGNIDQDCEDVEEYEGESEEESIID